jgi:hypothetical protein
MGTSSRSISSGVMVVPAFARSPPNKGRPAVTRTVAIAVIATRLVVFFISISPREAVSVAEDSIFGFAAPPEFGPHSRRG